MSDAPSFFKRLFPVSAPAASFARPFALLMFLSVMNLLSWVGGERASGR
jgi:hypothetical protein